MPVRRRRPAFKLDANRRDAVLLFLLRVLLIETLLPAPGFSLVRPEAAKLAQNLLRPTTRTLRTGPRASERTVPGRAGANTGARRWLRVPCRRTFLARRLRALCVGKKHRPSTPAPKHSAQSHSQNAVTQPECLWRRRRAGCAGGVKTTARSSRRAPAEAPPSGSTSTASSNGGAQAQVRERPTAAASACTSTAMR